MREEVVRCGNAMAIEARGDGGWGEGVGDEQIIDEILLSSGFCQDRLNSCRCYYAKHKKWMRTKEALR